MLSTIATATKAAAPFVGQAVAHGTKAVTAAAIAYKANAYGRKHIGDLVDNLSLAREAAQEGVHETANPPQATEQESA